MGLKLTAKLVSAQEGRGKGNTLVTATLEFDKDYAEVYAGLLAGGQGQAERWLADHAEAILLKKCRVEYKLEHDSDGSPEGSTTGRVGRPSLISG